jgi:O-Antigen ligase
VNATHPETAPWIRWRPLSSASLLPSALAAGVVVASASANGGYFPTSWGWMVLVFSALIFWVASVRVHERPTTTEAVCVASFFALAIWFALSSIWSVSSAALDETFRVLVYAAGVAAALSVVRRASARALLAGTLTGASAIALYALGTRLLPDRIGSFSSIAGYRLSTPLGYWNALGLFCAIAVLLSVALAASATSPIGAALAALPAPVLLLTLYFTFSRGSWLSLGAGLVVAIALDPRRIRLTIVALALAIPSSIGLLLASNSEALTHEGATVARAAHDGHRLVLIVIALMVVSALLAAGTNSLLARVTIPDVVSRAYTIALSALALLAVVAALIHFGGPAGAARRTWDSFAAAPPKAQGNLQSRLFNFSGTYRANLWRVAWHDFEAHPIIGSGAGSYEGYWLQRRTTPLKVKNAHSLYLETLAELGIVGLVLLIVALAAPLVAAFKARKTPGIAIATGAYVAYLVGAGVDWDWQLTSVTLAALFVGVALLAAARTGEERELSSRVRYVVMGFAAAIGAAGFVFLVGNMFLSRSTSAADKGNWAASARDAQRASDWLPWSTAPLDQLGDAQLGAGNLVAARASFKQAIAKDPGDWNLWFDLARASTGAAQTSAIDHATRLDPLAPEIAAFKSELGNEGGIGITVGK